MDQNRFKQGYYYSLYALCFSMPLFNNMQSISIMALGCCWLFSGQYRNCLSQLKKHSLVSWWVLLFFIQVFSLLYSDHVSAGIDEILRKSSFLLLPVFIGGGQNIEKEHLKKIYTSFVIGNVAAICWCTFHAFLLFRQMGITSYFYDNLASAVDNNAVNASWKCLGALIILLFFPTGNKVSLLNRPLVNTSLLFILLVFLILLSSKTLIVLALILIFSRVTYLLYTVKSKRILYNVFIAISLAVPLFLYNLPDSPLKRRYLDITNAALIMGSDKAFDISSADNFSKRMALWKAAWENLGEDHNYLTGCGIGDLQALQNKKLEDTSFHYKNFYNLKSLQNFNVHNTYLQTWLATGLAGLMALMGLLLGGLVFSIRQKNRMLLAFLILAVIFLIQESAFQVQAGIVYLCSFTCIWANHYSIPAFQRKSKSKPWVPNR